MGAQGQDFELLVRDVETLLLHAYGLQAEQVRMQWRYRPIGRNSGQPREVDVALFVDAGPRTLLVAIECRDRKGRQGVRWIEQIAGKRTDIGADRMVAVSRDGFTPNAVRLAASSGIELYVLAERAAFPDGKALAHMQLTVMRPTVRVLSYSWRHLGMMLSPTDPQPELKPAEIDELSRAFEEPNWVDVEAGKLVSLREALASILTWESLLEGVSTDGQAVVRCVQRDFDPGRFRLHREFPAGAMVALSSIRGEFEVAWVPEIVDANRVLQYRSEGGDPLLELHEYDGKAWGLNGQTVYFAPVAQKRESSPG